jgi:alpha-tubulin suppressor-like RCC1 family protein
LAWTAPGGDGGTPISDYKIEYSTNGVAWTVFKDGVSTSNTATVTGLTRGTSYLFRVSAINTAGAGSPGGFVRTKSVTGGGNSCALGGDGSIDCWGYNGYGQLGDGTTTDSMTPVTVSGITDATDVAGGDIHNCALVADQTIRCWGYNGYGQLGNGTGADSATPVSVIGITNAVAISGGWRHTCAVLDDGTVRCWGYNGYGQLGDGTEGDSMIPVTVSSMPE